MKTCYILSMIVAFAVPTFAEEQVPGITDGITTRSDVQKETRDKEIGVTYSFSEEAQVVTFDFRLDETGFEVHGVVDHGANPNTMSVHSNIAITEKDRERIKKLSIKIPPSTDRAATTFAGMLAMIYQYPAGQGVGTI